MAVSITTLLSPLDKQEVLGDLYDLLGVLFGQPLALNPGEPIPAALDTFVGWTVDQLWNPIVLPALQAQFGDFATGDYLTLLAQTLWRRPRIEQLQGTMSVVLENRGSFSGSLPICRVKNAVGKTYTVAAGSGTLPAYVSGPFPTVTVTFIADEAGTGSNAQPGDISVYPTPLVAGPIGVYVQSNAACLGSDEEADPQLLARGRSAVGELASAAPPKSAYESIGKDPTGAFTRRLLTPPWPTTYQPAIARVRPVVNGYANITVYLASSSGPAAGDTATPGTDVYNANVAIQLFAVPAGTTAIVVAATANNVALGTITLAVAASSNVTAAEAISACQTRLVTFFEFLPIGGNRKSAGGPGFLYLNKLQGVIESPDYVVEADMPGFTADLMLGAGQVVVATYTIAANIVDQS
jgi:hypothetical protein